MELYLINSFGDLFEFLQTFYPPNLDNMTLEDIQNYLLITIHCTCLYKEKSDLSDIFLGHNSWYYYIKMTGIFKEYNLNFIILLLNAKLYILNRKC